jgi:hypothetical protein
VSKVKPQQNNIYIFSLTGGNYIPRHTDTHYVLTHQFERSEKDIVEKESTDIDDIAQHFVCFLFANVNIEKIVETNQGYSNTRSIYELYSKGAIKSNIYVWEEADSYVRYHIYNIYRRVRRDKFIVYTEYGVIKP